MVTCENVIDCLPLYYIARIISHEICSISIICMRLFLTFFQHQSRSARLIRNARPTLHVYKKSVKTHVTRIHVDETPNVQSKTIVPFVFACSALSEIHTHSVKNVRFILFRSIFQFRFFLFHFTSIELKSRRINSQKYIYLIQPVAKVTQNVH